MSLDEMLNRTMTIYRPTWVDGVMGTQKPVHALVASGVPCAVNRPKAVIGEAGPGLAALGDRTVYCEAGVDVQERDILNIDDPPEYLLEVDGPPASPWDDHTELRTRLFHGTLNLES